MLGDEPTFIVERFAQDRRGQRAGHTAQRVHGGDRRELVVALIEQLGKHIDGVERTAGPAGEELQRFGCSQSGDDSGAWTTLSHASTKARSSRTKSSSWRRRPTLLMNATCLAEGVPRAGHQVEHR